MPPCYRIREAEQFREYAKLSSLMTKKTETPVTPLGRRLLAAIEQSGIKKTELDARVGTNNKVSGYVSGTAGDPRGATLAELCNALSTSPLWLYEASDTTIRDYLERVVRRELGEEEAQALVLVRGLKKIPLAPVNLPAKREPFVVDEEKTGTRGQVAKDVQPVKALKAKATRRRMK